MGREGRDQQRLLCGAWRLQVMVDCVCWAHQKALQPGALQKKEVGASRPVEPQQWPPVLPRAMELGWRRWRRVGIGHGYGVMKAEVAAIMPVYHGANREASKAARAAPAKLEE
jgi:hypothetical protein